MDVRDAVAFSLLADLGVGLGRRRLAAIVRGASHRQPPPPDLLSRVLIRLDPTTAARRTAELRDAASRALDAANRAGQAPIAWGTAGYPARLATLVDPPIVLWVEGDGSALAIPAVALVGSRAASPYALEVAGRLAADLAARGVAVVSGLARGVDSAAHRGALRTGCTVAVLGSGLDIVYPPEHRPLAQAIAGQGALVSELPPGTPPLPHHFPLRNRLISGLSLAVVVIEASERSGSLITAACALDQGREVMAVPGNVLSGRNRGAHALLRDGAKMVETADDILEELPSVGRTTESMAALAPDDGGPQGGVPGILAGFPAGEPFDLDDLAARTGLAGGPLLARLAELELAGRVRRVGGGRFVRSE
ncbi:MAG: DNA-processing protein DprA [Acidobacteriota bacterium]|nr:DNA-processing protein DprA [Acidobacteriota bacterium]